MIELHDYELVGTEIDGERPFGITYEINQHYGTGFHSIYQVSTECSISITKLKLHEETLVENQLPSCYTLLFYLTGSGNEFSPFQSIAPNSLRIYQPTELFKVIYHPQVEVTCVRVELTPYFIEQFLSEHYTAPIVDFKSFFHKKNRMTSALLSKTFYEVYQYKKICCPSLFFTAKLYTILAEIATWILEQNRNNPSTSRINQDDLASMAEVIQYIDEHYNYDISLELLSRIACMSISKLKSLFKQLQGMSTSEYIQRKRMSVAEHLLLTTDLQINEIASVVGYSNPSRFTELFKRYYGVMPSSYRGSEKRNS